MNTYPFFTVRFEEREDVTVEVIMPDPSKLCPGKRPIVIVTHDESFFDAHDGKHQPWIHSNCIPLLKKSKGKSIMVSGFATGLGFLEAPNTLSPGDLSHLWVCGDVSCTSTGPRRTSPYTSTATLECGKGVW